MQYTHLLVELNGRYVYETEHLKETHNTLETVNCFSNIGLEYRSILPVSIKTKPCISILKRKDGIKPPKIIEAESKTVPKEIPIKVLIDENENVVELEEEQQVPIEDPSNDLDEENGNVEDEPVEIIEPQNEWKDKIDDAEFPEMQKTNKQIKIKYLIEKHYRRKAKLNTDVARVQKQSAKLNIKNIIKTEKIKEMAEKISQMDLKAKCNLETESVKGCLIKIIEEFDVK